MQVTSFVPQEVLFPTNVFVVSSNANIRAGLREKLSYPRWKVVEAGSGAVALEVLNQHRGGEGVLLLDPGLPDLEPGEFQRMIQRRFPNTQVVTMNLQSGDLVSRDGCSSPLARSVMDLLNMDRFAAPLASVRAIDDESGRALRRDANTLRGMVGETDPMQSVFRMTRMVAARDTTVLVMGESGTGKDLVAQEIHQISPRRKQAFVVMNCSAIPESLLEAELFGYSKGAFTGAVQSRIGRVHAAHGGTLFLDEIGDMPLSLQSKLLRFLEQGEVQRLGGNDNLKVDVRVVAATNVDLKKQIERQQFREDLYYRLAVFPIILPPLRERMGDLRALAVSFIARFQAGKVLSEEALTRLRAHPWPGNVRELRNVIERATILAGQEREILAEHIVL
ncbi:MAG: sigma-54 dependent transcriptional regulator [Acidobacteriota bacterium]